jgi:hypothetical protein
VNNRGDLKVAVAGRACVVELEDDVPELLLLVVAALHNELIISNCHLPTHPATTTP